MTSTASVELLMREPVYGTHNRQQSVVRELRELESAGRVDEVDVTTWGKRLVLDDDRDRHTSSTARERFREFEAWAERTGHSLEPAFARRTLRIDPDAAPKAVVDLPVICLAVFDDGLRAVLPCADGDETYTVDDGLRMLAGEGDPVPGLDRRKVA
ncbi:HTH domain-containing protein [Halostella salina]|uniref:HTH domain-containing protein n=1 Tax=Halostella salina TaxID=1547897 RepID=UPI000EF7F8CB|nr:HTH domain-containing protein [Halostella salina]